MQLHPRKILIHRIGQLGDTIIALPALWAVRRAFPGAHITLLTSKSAHSNYVVAADVLPTGLIDECLTYPYDENGAARSAMLKLIPKLWLRRFDLVVYLNPRYRNHRSVVRDVWFFRLAGVRHVVAYDGAGTIGPRRPDQPLRWFEHEVDHLLDRLESSGIPVPAPADRKVDLGLTPDELKSGLNFLSSHGLTSERLLVAVGPGAKWPSKLWPKANYSDLITTLIHKYDVLPVVVGGPEDAQLGSELIAGWGRGINAAGALSIRHSAAVLSYAPLYIGNDTGPTHLAAAAGATCVAIFAAIDWPGRWHPYGPQHVTIRHDVDCSGCMLVVCTEQQMKCVKSITVAEVLAACEKVLAGITTAAARASQS